MRVKSGEAEHTLEAVKCALTLQSLTGRAEPVLGGESDTILLSVWLSWWTMTPAHDETRPAGKTRRLSALLIFGILLVAAGLIYRRYWLSRPDGQGPAGPAVPAEPFQEPWTKQRVLLLGVGDSITAGLGASRPDLSYFRRLVENPADEFPDMQGRYLSAVLPNLESRNIAVSGSNSIEHLRPIESLPVQDPDVMGIIVMTIGDNDLIHWYGRQTLREGAMYGASWEQARPWIAAFEKRLHRMIDMLKVGFPGGCRIFLGDIHDSTDGVEDAPSVLLPNWPDGLRIHAAHNGVIHRCVRQRQSVALVPIHATFLGHGSHCTQF